MARSAKSAKLTAACASAACRTRDLVGLLTLAPATSCFAHLLAALHARLHVVAAALELAQDAFSSHLALEVLDGALDALVANLDFERLTLNGFSGVRQGTADMADLRAHCNPAAKAPFSRP